LRNVGSLKHRAVIMLAYGAGLRIGEACTVRVSDIDAKRMVLKVPQAKGGRDRLVMLSTRLLAALRTYWKTAKPVGPYLFPTKAIGGCLTRGAVRRQLLRAVERAAISKRVTPHTLRHCFATHLLEGGIDLRTLQMLMGHASIVSTTAYLHVSTARVQGQKSPLDLLGTPAARIFG
jgi:integrase/recombinase XerD